MGFCCVMQQLPTVSEVNVMIVNLNIQQQVTMKVRLSWTEVSSSAHVSCVTKTGVCFKVWSVFKEGEPRVFHQHTPIYSLLCLSKVLEKFLYTRTIQHICNLEIEFFLLWMKRCLLLVFSWISQKHLKQLTDIRLPKIHWYGLNDQMI